MKKCWKRLLPSAIKSLRTDEEEIQEASARLAAAKDLIRRIRFLRTGDTVTEEQKGGTEGDSRLEEDVSTSLLAGFDKSFAKHFGGSRLATGQWRTSNVAPGSSRKPRAVTIQLAVQNLIGRLWMNVTGTCFSQSTSKFFSCFFFFIERAFSLQTIHTCHNWLLFFIFYPCDALPGDVAQWFAPALHNPSVQSKQQWIMHFWIIHTRLNIFIIQLISEITFYDASYPEAQRCCWLMFLSCTSPSLADTPELVPAATRFGITQQHRWVWFRRLTSLVMTILIHSNKK